MLSPAPRKGNLVARLRGTGARKPILLLAHLDVVEARREDWSTDPFKLIEQDGYFYGRGTGDDKSMAATFVANLIRYKQEGYKPDRDIILALETDEEILDANALGIQLAARATIATLIDAEFALNEGGGVGLQGRQAAAQRRADQPRSSSVDFRLEVTNKGGHSSLPRKDNAIYRLAEGLVRLVASSASRSSSTRPRAPSSSASPQLEDEQMAADMRAVAVRQARSRGAVVARLSANPSTTRSCARPASRRMLEGGHADNALPQLARATRQLPHPARRAGEEVQATLMRVLADEQITVTPARASRAQRALARCIEEIMRAIEKLTAEFWPGIAVIPIMSAGATDGATCAMPAFPTYGHSGLAGDIDDFRAHGKDERVPVKSFFEGTSISTGSSNRCRAGIRLARGVTRWH